MQKVRSKKPEAWHLYNLDEDRSEAKNLAAERPEVLERLTRAYESDRTPNERHKLPLYD